MAVALQLSIVYDQILIQYLIVIQHVYPVNFALKYKKINAVYRLMLIMRLEKSLKKKNTKIFKLSIHF